MMSYCQCFNTTELFPLCISLSRTQKFPSPANTRVEGTHPPCWQLAQICQPYHQVCSCWWNTEKQVLPSVTSKKACPSIPCIRSSPSPSALLSREEGWVGVKHTYKTSHESKVIFSGSRSIPTNPSLIKSLIFSALLPSKITHISSCYVWACIPNNFWMSWLLSAQFDRQEFQSCLITSFVEMGNWREGRAPKHGKLSACTPSVWM